MKTELALISLLALSGVAMFFTQGSSTLQMEENPVFQQYQAWKSRYGKNNNSTEDAYRFAIFMSNMNFVEQHNAESTNLKLALNKFADMTVEEFSESQLMRRPVNNNRVVSFHENKNAAPSSVNWIEKGAVNPIQNQGNCGSCWAFSATSTLESLHAISEGQLLKFSEQQITSCDKQGSGCNGGLESQAMEYTIKAGIELEDDYPYVQENNPITAKCAYDESKVVWHNAGEVNIPENDLEEMVNVVSQNPISIAISAGNIYFQLYSSGTLDTESCPHTHGSLDHAVGVVGYEGYGTSDNYWIVRNSWGTDWGLDGYAHFAMNSGPGVCGMNLEPSYATA